MGAALAVELDGVLRAARLLAALLDEFDALDAPDNVGEAAGVEAAGTTPLRPDRLTRRLRHVDAHATPMHDVSELTELLEHYQHHDHRLHRAHEPLVNAQQHRWHALDALRDLVELADLGLLDPPTSAGTSTGTGRVRARLIAVADHLDAVGRTLRAGAPRRRRAAGRPGRPWTQHGPGPRPRRAPRPSPSPPRSTQVSAHRT